MNREIKFRGKRVDDGEWIVGYLVRFDEHSASIVRNYGTMEISIYDVIPESVGQYTGLCDSKRAKEYPNGQPIYEGDIVECVYDGNMNRYVVVYDLSELGFKATNGKENYGSNFEYLPCCEEVVIIGSIHDNPSLLEVQS